MNKKAQRQKAHRRNWHNKRTIEGTHRRLEAKVIEKRLTISLVSLRYR